MAQRVKQQEEGADFLSWVVGSLLLSVWWVIKASWRSIAALKWAFFPLVLWLWLTVVEQAPLLAVACAVALEGAAVAVSEPKKLDKRKLLERLSLIQQLRVLRRERKALELAREWSVAAGLISLKEVEGQPVGKIYRLWYTPQAGVGYIGFLVHRPGLSTVKVQNAVDEFSRLLGCAYGTVRAAAGEYRLTFYPQKPALPSGVIDFPASSATVDRLPVGVDIEGQQVAVQLFESNLLVAGLPGSGKSGFVNAFLGSVAPLVESGLVKLSGLDPKVVELSPWASMFENIATEPEEFTELLQALNQEMDDRYRGLMADGSRKIRPSSRTPILVLVIDELAEVTSSGDSKRDKEVTALIRRLVQKGRAAGVFVLAATQRPSTDIVPSSLRDLFVQRVAFALANKESARMILGAYDTEGAAVEDGPWTISGAERGVGFLMAASDRSPKKFKTWWVADERVQEIVRGGR